MTLLGRAQSAAARAYGFETTSDEEFDLFFITQDVEGPEDIGPLNDLIEGVNDSLSPEVPLVINSQVPPGFTRTWMDKRKHLYYQVDTLITNCALERALYPERIIVGTRGSLHPAYSEFLDAFSCSVLTMSYESAELAKLAINFYLASSITVANTCAEIAERIGADWNQIIPALKSDKRIGQHAYLNPGVPGGHLTRDLLRIQVLAKNKDFINAILNPKGQ